MGNQTLVYYAGITSLVATQIAITFTLDYDYASGNTISVVPPAGYMLTCSMEGSLKTISLPGGRPDCIDDPLELYLTQPLTRGSYAFAVTADLPSETPVMNNFNLIIKDRSNNVVDARNGVPGKTLVDFGAESPTLTWSRAGPGQVSEVTIGLTFTRNTQSLQALLIMLPERFRHDVQKPTDVQNSNSRFPVAPGRSWADTSKPNRIKIYFDDNVNIATIPADVYSWRFPALMPQEVPKVNIWFICLCSDQRCEHQNDMSVLVTFPVAGFDLGETPPGSLRPVASSTPAASSTRQRARLFGAFVWPALFASLAAYL